MGLAVSPTERYALIKDGDEYIVLVEERISAYYREEGEYSVERFYTGRELAGVRYEPLMPYYAELADNGAFAVHAADYVTVDEGSGVVHLAPGFGEDDYQVLKDSGLPIVAPIDADCRFVSPVDEYAGMFVKDADKAIIARLKNEGKLARRENYRHSYPFCYRTDTPLIYRAVASWFVNVEKIKERMIAANQQIDWAPSHLKNGRFGKWLENARDWAISRNRFWGNPIPIWKCDGSDYTECIGSLRELEEKSGQAPADLHKHFLDAITWPSPDGKGTMRRVPEVLDCWFESGAMPYAQNHYPFENRDRFEANFPADFICEGLDQTRGWFYTLTVLAAALFDRPAYKHVVVNGLVLDQTGKKMAKRDRNYTDPKDVINRFGADALRLFLLRSAVTMAEDLKYSDAGVKDMARDALIPLWNAYSFFVTYANIDGFVARESALVASANFAPSNLLDRWIVSESERLLEAVSSSLDRYDLQRSIAPIITFIDSLNNWYIRRSRRRFWRSVNDDDKISAYRSLYFVLVRLVVIAAPFIPFITEDIYRNLRCADDPISIHLCDWPSADSARRDLALERQIALCRRAVSMGHAIRRQHNIKIRQPLREIKIVSGDSEERALLLEAIDIIRDEVNVKRVTIAEDETEFVSYRAKPNYPLLGKHLGKAIRVAAKMIAEMDSDAIHAILSGGTHRLEDSQFPDGALIVDRDAIVVERVEKEGLFIMNDRSLTAAIDATIDDELWREGWAREIVRAIQRLRKDCGLNITSRIELTLWAIEIRHYAEIKTIADRYGDYIQRETLSSSLRLLEEAPAAGEGAHGGAVTLAARDGQEDLGVSIAISEISEKL